ncbi:response regulator [Methylocucumis oryzae]|uniref:Chemotaxis protein CheY n=1 Tax=Methylocucumis oryzae TaxID=1632867 RepID=A0A0F3IF23_9GAMM|nr:response regulator [Methylocucumis oryzae]KJV05118.1 chemotaxis protein CheY [Methylocucumis oryzae]
MTDLIRILYVEDDPDIREVAEFALEDEGFELISCASGQEALTQATNINVDLLLLDVMMPGMDGPTTLTKLRELPNTKQTPAVFMTAKVQSSEIAAYLAMGAIGVITKPFDALTLAEHIRELLEKQHGSI